MRVFQPTWSHPDRGGDIRISARWCCEFRWRGRKRPCRLGLFTDRKASDEVARRIERLMAVRESGSVPDPDMSRWLELAPRRVVEYLAKFDIIDARWTTAACTLDEHLAAFKAGLTARGSTAQWIKLVCSRTRRVLSGCKARGWSSVTATAVERYLADERKGTFGPDGKLMKRGISIQTSNFCLAAIKQFGSWLIREGRATTNPLAYAQGLNVRVDRRHDRRALSVEELRQLLTVTAAGPDQLGASGPERAMLYRTAAETGLRANELRSLTRSSFTLAASPPTIRVEAGYSKRRREDAIPLRPDTASALAAFLASKLPAAPAFRMPSPTSMIKMLRADLEAARDAWIGASVSPQQSEERQESDFLVYRDRTGRVADFHAFRHTFITNLIGAGVHPRTAQALARHSTITLTMDRYGHLLRGAETDALAALPSLAAESANATTDRLQAG